MVERLTDDACTAIPCCKKANEVLSAFMIFGLPLGVQSDSWVFPIEQP